VGDAKVFHHFRDGCCSCRDYWWGSCYYKNEMMNESTP
jgi:hypothetical protein